MKNQSSNDQPSISIETTGQWLLIACNSISNWCFSHGKFCWNF